MSFLRRNAAWTLISFALLVIILFACLKPAGNRLSKIQIRQYQSDTQLKGITKLVLDYESKHGGMPRNLSELVPDDRTDLLSIFYAPNETLSQKPVSCSTNKAILEQYSDYALSLHSNSDIVAFEKTGLWPDGSVAVCLTNLSVERISASAFKSLLKNDDSASTMPPGSPVKITTDTKGKP